MFAGFTGIDDPYEVPLNCEVITLSSEKWNILEQLAKDKCFYYLANDSRVKL